MQHLLNTSTNTLHTPRDGRDGETAVCGSLEHVPQARIQVVSEEDLRTADGVDRCGNCFEDAGGY